MTSLQHVDQKNVDGNSHLATTSHTLRTYGCSKQEISPHPRFSSVQVNGYTFENKKLYAVQRQYQLGTSISPLKPLHTACADRLEREVHQLDRAAPLKVCACRVGTREGSSVEVFTLGHALCRSYLKVEASALSSTPKFEGGPARDVHGARVARRVGHHMK